MSDAQYEEMKNKYEELSGKVPRLVEAVKSLRMEVLKLREDKSKLTKYIKSQGDQSSEQIIEAIELSGSNEEDLTYYRDTILNLQELVDNLQNRV